MVPLVGLISIDKEAIMKTRLELITSEVKSFLHKHTQGLISTTELILVLLENDVHVSAIRSLDNGMEYLVMCHSDSENSELFPVDLFTVTVSY